ncbi:hypothetical protein E1264_15775 [Actinomadura sp. KC216]|uniref:hypothetical protein n=1 Tax=Actinomadura sp. KC216 TaxID=2530370 RepID=UPI001046E404|nr:hypothetical protein [Actinomadura sp. KC216]TDB87074.1 hypothetical protein E1264_15775 [Actinomadura sp. KC216]
MAQTQARVHWMIWLATGAVTMGLGVFLLTVGLDDADKYASMIGALGTITGLGLSLSALFQRSSQAGRSEDEPGVATGQQIRKSTIGGDSFQVRGVGGNVRIRRTPTPPPSDDASQPLGGTAPPPDSPGAQSVTDSKITGSSAQIDQVTGDVDIERGT